MKTSVIEVRDMLSVLSVDGVEKRIGEVPGVESVTVNFAAKNATVRYDETRLEVADIKSDVRQRGHQPATEPPPEQAGNDRPGSVGAGEPATQALPKTPSPPAAEVPKADPVAAPESSPGVSAEVPQPKAPAGGGADDSTQPGAIEKLTTWVHEAFAFDDKGPAQSDASPASGAADASKAAAAATALPASPAPAGSGHEGHQGRMKPGDQPAMSADMAHEMGHDGMDLPAMVRDMRNRFWICLVFTVPIFIYAPMGGMFKPPHRRSGWNSTSGCCSFRAPLSSTRVGRFSSPPGVPSRRARWAWPH